MFKITIDFPGGNAVIHSVSENKIKVSPDLRDTVGDWFYWAFRVDGAQGQTLTFEFDNDARLGYYGPAVSYDYKSWHWMHETEKCVSKSFTYSFSEDEKSVYFAHSMLYRPERLYEFAESVGLKTEKLCASRKGREIPCFTIGSGKTHIVLTSRHHACESSGSYVLEGVLSSLIKSPIPNTTVFCVPMVDFDGVYDGDQGKNRAPHDHAREYDTEIAPIYPESARIREYFEKNPVELCIDFHSPWHFSGENDKVFIPIRSVEKFENIKSFSRILEKCITPDSMKYFEKDDHLPNVGWNQVDTPAISKLGLEQSDTSIAFTIETCYFGLQDNIFSQERAIAFGHCVANAMREYIAMLG